MVQRKKIHKSLQILPSRFKVLIMVRCVCLKFIVHFQECSVKNNSPQSSSILQHQSKSFPPRHLQRTSSISSESSLENLHQVNDAIEETFRLIHCGFYPFCSSVDHPRKSGFPGFQLVTIMM